MAEIVLLIDSCTADLAVTILGDGQLIRGRIEPAGPLKGARLLPLIEEVMSEAAIAYGDLRVIAAGRGPGTFTGIRTGLATALGIGTARGIPVYGICPLLALGAPLLAGNNKPVLVQMDARRHQVYARLMERAGSGLLKPLSDPLLLDPDQVEKLYNTRNIIISSPGASRMSSEGLRLSFLSLRSAGQLPPPIPIYIRPPDAKIPVNAG